VVHFHLALDSVVLSVLESANQSSHSLWSSLALFDMPAFLEHIVFWFSVVVAPAGMIAACTVRSDKKFRGTVPVLGSVVLAAIAVLYSLRMQ
jgi:hypothetical protein